MGGIIYINKSNQTVSLTDTKYFNCPAQYKKLRVRTGTNVNDTIGYGLTTDITASGYSPLVVKYTNGSNCFIGTYSTGSSSASGTYRYTVESGYVQYVTGQTALTEQRTGQGEETTWEESGTRQDFDSVSTGSYYSIKRTWDVRTSYSYAYGYSKREGNKEHRDNPHYGGTFMGYGWGGTTYNKNSSSKEPSGQQYTVYNTSALALSGYASTSLTSGASGLRVYSEVEANPGIDTLNYYKYSDVCTTYTSFRKEYGSTIEGRTTTSKTVYKTVTTYTTKTSQLPPGVYTVTTGWRYGYGYSYTERTSTSSNSDGQRWTHSNINVL